MGHPGMSHNGMYSCTVVERTIRNFQDLAHYQVHTICMSLISYIGDLRSGQFRDLPIISQCGKLKYLKYLLDLFKLFRTMLN